MVTKSPTSVPVTEHLDTTRRGSAVDILILGAGWTSTFLEPLCDNRSISYAATTRDGRNGTIKFAFDPSGDSGNLGEYEVLPDAQTVLITFPITKPGGSELLVKSYYESREESRRESIAKQVQFIQLGTTGIWDGQRNAKAKGEPLKAVENKWYDRKSPFQPTDRAKEEEELLKLSNAPHAYARGTAVLNLAGLWGGPRSPKNWVKRVAPTKEALKLKGSVHLIHGIDVARVIVALHDQFDKAKGQRWIVNDGRVYDWWDLASAWGDGDGDGTCALWVRELMEEAHVRGLPRSADTLGRAFDSQDLWRTFGLTPEKTLFSI
ncbi:hypothetical protein FA15DRAFT_665897 [Coprinopsis marcescibilis]|uniref:NAD(P)-binding protein n=1 Tax=Coprinopsis marcescibilis TaxID=230819 RepID=A0A5C3L5A2_COPMA|nr:hypothetical protein FA15DRAFT_665897 [Coprinopsis marcescibilis]